MTVYIDIRDRHGYLVDLGQRVALKVTRCSGSYGSWWRKSNSEHFTGFWLPGHFELNRLEIVFRPDEAAEKSLEQPMGKERISQNVDHLNVDFFDPENLDVVDVPAPGTWRRA